MNLSHSSTLRSFLFASLVLGAMTSAFGQGNNNPTGTYGVFNGNSTTGDSYDPYTGNATRTVPDLVVSGAVGAYPLVWSRTLNSRGSGLAGGGAWYSSYRWTGSVGTYQPLDGLPSTYTINYPDGRITTFTTSTGNGPLGVSDHFVGIDGVGDCYLLLSDGGKVHFYQTGTYDNVNETWSNLHLLPPDQITDPHGLVTTLTYNASNQLTKVTEPAGRWLKVYYNSDYTFNHVDAGYGAGTVTQSVAYTYTSQPFSGVSYTLLTKASYSDSTSATYTYQASNVNPSGYPLIKTCADVRYPGPMKNITYTFKAGGAYGYLYQEKETGATSAIVTLATSPDGLTRTETRGDNKTRSWTYGATVAPYLLKTFTDFRGKATILGYDVNGFVSSVQDANLHTTSLTRDPNSGVITSVTHPGGAVAYYDYDPSGIYLLDKIDELGPTHKTTYLHKPDWTVSEIHYPDGGIEKFTYTGVLKQVWTHTMVSAGTGTTGGTETFTYDAGGRGLLVQSYPPATASDGNPSAHPTVYGYDANDHLSTITDPRGNTTTLWHNERGQLTFVQNPDVDHSQTGYVYNDDGTLQYMNVEYSTTGSSTTSYTYDDYKRVRSVTTPGHPTPETTNFSYGTGDLGLDDFTHADANVTRTVLPSGKVLKNVYDENKRLSTAMAGYNTTDEATTGYTYDDVGNLLTKTEPKYYPGGAHSTYHYDTRDRLDYLIDPVAADQNSLGHTVDYTYDAASNKKSMRAANDQVTTYDSYDLMNRLTQMTVPQAPTASAVTKYTWTRTGKVDTMTDPKLNVYNYDYDAQNRLITATYPGGKTETRIYDFASNLATFKNRAGDIQTFIYDARNRETRYDWDDGVTPFRTLTYDDASRLTACNATGTAISYTYFADGSLQSQAESTGYFGDNNVRTLNYTYDADGNRGTTNLAGVLTYTYNYTNRNQLSTVTQGSTTWATYGYDYNGNVATRKTFNGVQSTFSYDAANRLTDISHPLLGGSKTFHYTYDEMGNRLTGKRNASVADSFGYDKNSQLLSFQPGGGAVTNFTLDAAGNRTAAGGKTYVPNALNQYTSVGGQGATYDANGNVLTRYDKNNVLWSYTYDAMNRLTLASSTAGNVYYYYDGLNRQIARATTGQPVAFPVWDGWEMFTEYLTGNFRNRIMVHGRPGDLVTQWGGSAYNTLDYYPDGLGSTAYVADSSKNLVEQYTYDAYGIPSFFDASGNTLSATACATDHLFTGQQWHPATALYDNRHRFYSPEWGRFLQPDPIGFDGDASNLYRYCENNPANGIDPSGTDVQGIWSGTERHAYWGVPNPNGGTTFFDFYPKYHNVGSTNLGPGIWSQQDKRPEGTEYLRVATSSTQDAQIYKDLSERVADQGDTYSVTSHNCLSAPLDVIALSGVKVLIHDIAEFFRSLFGGSTQQSQSGANQNQQQQSDNPYASAGYNSPEDYFAAHQESDLHYSNAQALPTWSPFYQPDFAIQFSNPNVAHNASGDGGGAYLSGH